MTTSVNATLAGSRPLSGVSALGKGGMGGGFGVNLFASAFSPLDLFAANEVGAWYDPSDLTTMFQDRAGTTPVTADGQTVGLILDKSKGLVFPSGAPSGFGAVPFNVSVNNDGTTDFDPTAYRLVEGASGVTTYYVDKATGSDTNPGTAAQPWKTIQKACTVSRATAPSMLLKVKGGTYYLTENFNAFSPQATSFSVVSWDGNPVICSNENSNITPASWTLDSDNTYYASVAGYGYSEYGSSVWDAKVGDGFGDYLPLIPAASIAACKATANTYYTDTASLRVYVHCSDNRAPDADIHVFEAWGAPGQYRDYAGSPANGACYFENIHFRGGSISFALQQTHATNTTQAVFNGCSFKYSTSNQCFQVSGNIDVALDNCLVAESHADGFSYHSYGANPAPRAIEIDCEARRCGTILTGTANQGSTIHDGGKIVRVNGNYHHNENDQVADVGAGTKVWMVRCTASDGLKANYAGYLAGNGAGATTTWLYDCTVSNCSKDLTIGVGATLHDKNYLSRSVISNSGTVTNFAEYGKSGNHATAPTDAARPLKTSTGLSKWINYDGVDDSLNSTFPSSLGSSCTVARAIVGSSPTILTSQTIGTSYADSTDHAGLVIINRALTTQETNDLTAWLTAKGATA